MKLSSCGNQKIQKVITIVMGCIGSKSSSPGGTQHQMPSGQTRYTVDNRYTRYPAHNPEQQYMQSYTGNMHTQMQQVSFWTSRPLTFPGSTDNLNCITSLSTTEDVDCSRVCGVVRPVVITTCKAEALWILQWTWEDNTKWVVRSNITSTTRRCNRNILSNNTTRSRFKWCTVEVARLIMDLNSVSLDHLRCRWTQMSRLVTLEVQAIFIQHIIMQHL